MDYGFFDALFDSVFVFNKEKQVLYCNEAAASLCDSSVRRLTKGKKTYEIFNLDNSELYTNKDGALGSEMPFPYEEMGYSILSNPEKKGKVQVTIHPFAGNNEQLWICIMRDVTLEESLHAKYHGQLEAKEVVINELQEARSELEKYSKNLESMVQDRTSDLRKANGMLSAIMNSLGQGFFVFDSSRTCSNIYTKACETILGVVPKGLLAEDVLQLSPKEMSIFKMWVQATFEEKLPFDSLKDLGPSHFEAYPDKNIPINYFPIRNDQGAIENILVVATDKTKEFQAEKALVLEKQFVQMIINVLRGKKQFRKFMDDILVTYKHFSSNVKNAGLEEILRALHTIEGEAGTFSAFEIVDAAKKAQDLLRDNPGNENFQTALDEIKKGYEDFCDKHCEFLHKLGVGDSGGIELSNDRKDKLLSILATSNLSEDQKRLFEEVLFCEPLESLLSHYDELVESISLNLGKKVDPIIFEGDVQLDFEVYGEVLSSLVHFFRNVVDHGVELPEERIKQGKSASAQIKVISFEQNGWVHIELKDNGKGIDPEILRKKFSAEKLKNMSNEDVLQLVFEDGVSTRSEVGEYSGRGIGMSAIKAECLKLGGMIKVESTVHKGTSLKLSLPRLSRNTQPKVAA